jgi:hypothetical protein
VILKSSIAWTTTYILKGIGLVCDEVAPGLNIRTNSIHRGQAERTCFLVPSQSDASRVLYTNCSALERMAVGAKTSGPIERQPTSDDVRKAVVMTEELEGTLVRYPCLVKGQNAALRGNPR